MPLGFLIFAHRHNTDGTIDSICSRCFQTIATVLVEADLPRIESRHVCVPHNLERIERLNSSRRKRAMNRSQSW